MLRAITTFYYFISNSSDGLRALRRKTSFYGLGKLAAEAHIIFKRIGTNNVIVVRCLQPQCDATGLIDASRNRLEADRNFSVLA